MSELELARLAHEAYRAHSGGKSILSGAPLPSWEELTERHRHAWLVAIIAVKDALENEAK